MAKRYNHGSSEEQDPGQFGATELATTGSPVSNKAAAPPSAGQVLTATSPTESDWQDPSNAVDSVFGRTGAVVAQAGDYSAAFVDYDNAGSGLVATTVQAAIDEVEAAIPAPAPVDSVFGRTGAVVAAASDYTAAQVDYDNAGSGLVATTVQAAIDEVEAAIPAPAPVDSVFGRTGAVVAAASDYDADQVDYDNTTSGLAATDVKAALDELAAAGGGVVSSVFGRTGAIVAVAGDYDADQVDYDNATSGLTATDVKAALDELAASGGGLDIAALTEEVPEAGDFLVFSDTSDGDNLKKVDWDDLPSGGGGGTADALATTGADVDVAAAAPPTTGQVLTATSATTATWQTPSGGGGVTLLTPDVIVPGMEFFDEAGRVLSGSNLTSWVSDSTDMTLLPVSANPPVRNSGVISGFTAVANPRSVMFGGIGIDDFVELSGGNGLSGALDGAPWSTTQDIYIGVWCQLLGNAGSMIAVESLALAFNGGQMGAFIRRNLDGAFAKGRRSLPEVMDSAGYLEMFYRRGLTGLDAVSAFAFNGVLMHNARVPTGLDYSLSVAPSNLYLGTDGAGTGDGAGALGVYRICLINNYMPTQTERMQLFNWASGNTFLSK